MSMHRSSLGSSMAQGEKNETSPQRSTMPSQVRRRSCMQNGQFSQKKISADLAHLGELDESPSRSKSRQVRQQNPMTTIKKTGYQRLAAGKDSLPNPQVQDSLQNSVMRLSRGTLQIYDEVTVNSSQVIAEGITQVQVNQANQPASEAFNSGLNMGNKKGLVGHVTLKIQAFEIEELEKAKLASHDQRNTAQARFRSEIVPRPTGSKLATGLNPRHFNKQQALTIQQPQQQQQQLTSESIWDRGAASVTDASMSQSFNMQLKASGFPSMKRKTEAIKDQIKQEQLERMFNRSSLGIQEIMDTIKSKSVIAAQNEVKPIHLVDAINRGGQRFRHKEFQPARVDIGLRGHMPFDDALLKNLKKNIPEGKRKSMFIAGESRKRASKSELGFHQTIESIVSASQVSMLPSKSPHSENEQLAATTTIVSTNHPGTLLKNFNPRIAPKNLGAERARKKVKNIAQQRKRPPTTQDSLQCNCQTETAMHLETCATVILLTAEKVTLQTLGSPPVAEIEDLKYQEQACEALHDSISASGSSQLSKKTMTPEGTTINKSELDQRLNSLGVSDNLARQSLILVEEQKQKQKDQTTNEGDNMVRRRKSDVVDDLTTSTYRQTKIVLENQHTDTHRLLFRGSDNLGENEDANPTKLQSPRISNAAAAESHLDDNQPHQIPNHRKSSREETIIKMGQPYVQIRRSFNQLKDEIVLRAQERVENQRLQTKHDEMVNESYKHQMHDLLQIAAAARTPSQQSCGPEHKEGCLCAQRVDPNATMSVERSPRRSSFFESLMREQQRRSMTYQKVSLDGTSTTKQRENCSMPQQAPFQRITAPIPAAPEEKLKQRNEQKEQKMQIKQIMREVQVSQQAQSLFNKPSTKAITFKQPLATNDPLNRHKKLLLNPVVPSQRATLSSRLGALENNRKLQSLGFRDPMLNMISSIHAYDESDEAKSTLYGFKARKRSCMEYPTGQSFYTDSPMAQQQQHYETLPGIVGEKSEPIRQSIYKVSKAPGMIASKMTSTTMSTFDSAKEKSQQQQQPKSLNNKRKMRKVSRSPPVDFGGLVAIIETQNSGLTTKNYGTKEQNSLAGSTQSPKWMMKVTKNNTDLPDLTNDIDNILIHDSIDQRQRSAGMQQSIEAPRTFGVSGGSVVVSKVYQAIRRKRANNQQPPVTSEQERRNGAQNQSVSVPSRGSRLMTQMSVRRSAIGSCLTGKMSQNQNSTVQMIELELPNLQIDESRVSPQRVMVLSRDLERQQNLKNLAIDYRRLSNKSSMEKLMAASDYNVANADIQALVDAKSVDQSDIQSEAEILRGMVATMRTSQNFAKKLSLKSQESTVENTKAAGNIDQSTSGQLQLATAAAMTSPVENSSEAGALKSSLASQDKNLSEAMKLGSKPKDLIRKLWQMSQQAKGHNSMDQGFCLQSGSAAIHDDHPLCQKMQYFGNLKQRDAQLKILHTQIQKLKVLDVKEQLYQRKMLNAAKPRAKTQLIQTKIKRSQDSQIEVQLQTTLQNEECVEVDTVPNKHTQSLKFSELDSPCKSKDHSRLDAQNNHLQEGSKTGTKFETQDLRVSDGPLIPANEVSLALNTPVQEKFINLAIQPQCKPDQKLGKNVTIKMSIGRNILKDHHKGRKHSRVTSTTIDLPPEKQQLNEMEQQIYQEANQAYKLISPNSNDVETQFCAAPPSEEDGKSNEPAATVTHKQQEELDKGYIKQQNQMEEKPSYVSLKQQQLENHDLDDYGHRQDALTGNKSFVSTVKRRSIHVKNASRKTLLVPLSLNSNEANLDTPLEFSPMVSQAAQP